METLPETEFKKKLMSVKHKQFNNWLGKYV